MSAILYAKHVRCDWPGCQSEDEIALDESNSPKLPAGWTDLGQFTILRPGGFRIGELCSIHSAATMAQLAEIFREAG